MNTAETIQDLAQSGYQVRFEPSPIRVEGFVVEVSRHSKVLNDTVYSRLVVPIDAANFVDGVDALLAHQLSLQSSQVSKLIERHAEEVKQDRYLP